MSPSKASFRFKQPGEDNSALWLLSPEDIIQDCLGQCLASQWIKITALGNPRILKKNKLALFCSTRCPGEVILRTLDFAQSLRNEGVTVVSGFHSPVERECLRILLRGQQPVIICPARTLDGMRLPAAWRENLNEGRLLVLSPFSPSKRRLTAKLAMQRNEFVAALADRFCFANITPGGQMEQLFELVRSWGKEIVPLP